MERSEQNPADGEQTLQERVEEIALRAAEMPVFQETVRNAEGRMEAIRDVRELLPKHFPEISELPEPKKELRQKYPGRIDGLIPPPSNDFTIAKNIVDLLWENK